jgi:hypothetical protein
VLVSFKEVKDMITSWIRPSIFVLVLVASAQMQTGGPYNLSHNVIASGGGSNSSGSTISVDGTVGQPAAGIQSNGPTLSVRGGFWMFMDLMPTAANVQISGRVVSPEGVGIGGVALTLTELSTGAVRTTQSSTFGYYRFNDVEVGTVYSVTATSRRYEFKANVQVIHVVDEIVDLNFVATSGS